MQLINNEYYFSGGVSVLEVLNKYHCPVYVYDMAIVERQYHKLRGAFQDISVKINYACKAMTNIAMLKLIRGLGAGLDAVSIQEIRLGLLAGYEPEEILFTPSGVSMAEIDEAVGIGVKINVDNLSILKQIGQKYPDFPVGIRINPHIMAGGNDKISTGHIGSKFGISYQQVSLVKEIMEALDMTIDGLHIHTGSEILDADVFLQGAELLFDLAMSFEDLTYIDFGGGFKVSYKENGSETDIADLGQRLSSRFKSFCNDYGRELTLKFEPGKFLVSEAGVFFAKVNVVKQSPSTLFAGVNSGLNHLIRPMFYNAYHSILNVTHPTDEEQIYTIVGYICETDTFGTDRKISKIEEGDVLAFLNAGAYCYSMSSNYNSRYRPAEVLIYKGKDYLIRERETFDDLILHQVNVDFSDVTKLKTVS